MLNGSHSFLAWLGYLAGHAHISDCMRDDVFRRAARQLMLDEQAPTLTITGVDLLAFVPTVSSPASAIRRSNTAPGKSPWTVARSCPSACSMASAYIWRATAVGRCWLSAWPAGCATSAAPDDAGQTIDVRDPLVDKIRQRVAQSDEQQRVDALLGLEEIFGRDLPHNAQFVAGIRAAWQQLATHGAREAVARALNS